MIKVNDIVRLAYPNEDENPNDIYTVIEVDNDRVLIESHIPGMYINPVQLVHDRDLEIVKIG